MKTKTNHCPACNELLDAATCLNAEATPSPGDLSICIHCASVLEFTEDLGLRLAPPDSFVELDEITQLQVNVARKALKDMKGGEQ